MFDWLETLFAPTLHPDIVQTLVVLLMVISIGFFIGKIKIGNVSLGVASVMFTGLLMGHIGYRMNENVLDFIRDFGLILFVYSIGIHVGPSFFSSFKKDGLKLNLLALGIVISGSMITVIIHIITHTDIASTVGMMSGAVTNTPGLGAAEATIIEIAKTYPHRTFNDPAIAYAITYPLGILGIIVSIIISKKLLKIDLPGELKTIHAIETSNKNTLVHQKCRVTNSAVIGKSIAQIYEEYDIRNIIISRLKNSGSKVVFSPSSDTCVKNRDVCMLVGNQRDVSNLIILLGKESTDLFIESAHDIISKNMYVTKAFATHKTLQQLDLQNKYGLKVTRIIRSGMEILAHPGLELYYGDTLLIVGNQEAIAEAEKIIGNSSKSLIEPDFLSLFGGLIIGIIIGSIPIMVPTLPVPVKLGFAAGPLLTALLISRYGGLGVLHSYVNNGAIYFMKDLGICLFFSAVGIHAGGTFYANFVKFNGWAWLFYGSLITFIPLMMTAYIGKYFMKLNFFQLAGIMSGAYTDPAALAFSNRYLDSEISNQAYATVYPMVTILRILVVQLTILLLI